MRYLGVRKPEGTVDRSESKRFGAEGGKKRAANLTKSQRSQQAALAAISRWHRELPVAQWGSPDKPLRLGVIEIPCYVLTDERRVLVQRGLQTAIGMSTSGGAGGAHRMARFIESLEAKGLPTNNLSVRMRNPIVFRIPRLPKPAYGYEATIITDICSSVVEAQKREMLAKNQAKFVSQCELLLRALAEKGITDLVDEVTGYKQDSDQREITLFLRAYVNTELREWVNTFPRSFFEQLCRLKNVPPPKENMRLPQYFGNIVNDLVYTRIAPGVLPELRTVNPVVGPKGRRRAKHHQFMTDNLGAPKLLNLVGLLEGMAHRFEDGQYDAYKAYVDRHIPNYGTLPLWNAADVPSMLAQANAKLIPAFSSVGVVQQELPLGQ